MSQRRNYYSLAETDLEWAQRDIKTPPEPGENLPYNPVVQRARAAAEKFLKHLHVMYGLYDFAKKKQTHDIQYLRRALVQAGFTEFEATGVSDACTILQRYEANVTEYPGARYVDIDYSAAKECVDYARLIRDTALVVLGRYSITSDYPQGFL
jgi:hypothetical protein